ncbi:hypothetical protein HQ576_05905 [bacterium]|nr:hypothetical protein [bacterium]
MSTRATHTLLLLTVDTEASMAGVRPLSPETMVYGRVAGGTYGIERIMDCCEARGMRATFFVSVLEALHYGEDHARRMCATCLDRGHDAQLHLHANWWSGDFARKRLTDYSRDEQAAALAAAVDIYRRACNAEPVAHRAGGLWLNESMLEALAEAGIPLDASVAAGLLPYEVGEGVSAPSVPRRLGSIVEVPVTTFRQVPLGRWTPMRHFDINADTLSELCFVVDRAVEQGVTAVSLLMHSFSFVGRNADSTRFWPAAADLAKFERFLDYVAARDDVEVVTLRELAERVGDEPSLLDGPDFAPTAGFVRTYFRSWQRFDAGWKNRVVAVGLPAAAVALAAAAWCLLRWIFS